MLPPSAMVPLSTVAGSEMTVVTSTGISIGTAERPPSGRCPHGSPPPVDFAALRHRDTLNEKPPALLTALLDLAAPFLTRLVSRSP